VKKVAKEVIERMVGAKPFASVHFYETEVEGGAIGFALVTNGFILSGKVKIDVTPLVPQQIYVRMEEHK
jgi:hypothetical protein